MITKFEREEYLRKKRIRKIIELVLIIVIFIVTALAVFFAPTPIKGASSVKPESIPVVYAEEPIPSETVSAEDVGWYMAVLNASADTTDDVLAQMAADNIQTWIVSDTPEEDMIDDMFETVVEVVEAEAGNQPEEGQRLVVDVIGNEAGWDMAKVKITHNRFNSYPDGCAKWRSSITEELRQLVADEWLREDKADGGAGVWYFRTGHYHSFGHKFKQVGDHYFSTR